MFQMGQAPPTTELLLTKLESKQSKQCLLSMFGSRSSCPVGEALTLLHLGEKHMETQVFPGSYCMFRASVKPHRRPHGFWRKPIGAIPRNQPDKQSNMGMGQNQVTRGPQILVRVSSCQGFISGTYCDPQPYRIRRAERLHPRRGKVPSHHIAAGRR